MPRAKREEVVSSILGSLLEKLGFNGAGVCLRLKTFFCVLGAS